MPIRGLCGGVVHLFPENKRSFASGAAEEEDPLKATGNGGQQSRGGIKGREKLMKAVMMDAEVSVGNAYGSVQI